MQVTVDKSKSFQKLPLLLQGISNIGIDTKEGKKREKRLAVGRDEDDIYDAIDPFTNPLSFNENLKIESPNQIIDYEMRRRKFHKIAGFSEIQKVLKAITDEAVVYDKFNNYCEISFNHQDFSDELKEEIKDDFKKIYRLWGFNDGTTAWEYWYKWMVDGYIAFEQTWDNPNKPTEILELVELDPYTLQPSWRVDKNGNLIKVWIQKHKSKFNSSTGMERIIPDQSVIFIAWNRNAGAYGKISYVESLERSFNLMRIMEDTKVGWHIMNAQQKLKISVPFSTRNSKKIKERLNRIKDQYAEEVYIDADSGNVQISGDKRFNFSKNIIMPKRQGSTVDIDSLAYQGPDLSRTDMNSYFERKYYRDSGVPHSRFDGEGGRGGGTTLFQADGIPYDEVMFHRDINRMRSEFSKLITKPLKTQFLSKHPEFTEDPEFDNLIGLEYGSNSLMEEAKRREIESRDIRHVGDLQRITYPNGNPYFSTELLMEEYFSGWDEDFKDKNEKARNLEKDNDEEGSGRSRGRY